MNTIEKQIQLSNKAIGELKNLNAIFEKQITNLVNNSSGEDQQKLNEINIFSKRIFNKAKNGEDYTSMLNELTSRYGGKNNK